MKSEPNRDHFVGWLKTFPSDAIVGTSRDDCDCPLARYLTTLHPKGVSVSSQGCWWIHSHMSAYYGLPLWAQRFIEAVDIPDEHETITADIALSIINGI